MKRTESPSEVWERGKRASPWRKASTTLAMLAYFIFGVFAQWLLFDQKWGLGLQRTALTRSLYLVALIVGLLVFYSCWTRRLHKRERQGSEQAWKGLVCEQCGYARGEENRCPECGTLHRIPRL